MRLHCPHCDCTLAFTGAPPAFCAYCGKALKQEPQATTDEFKIEQTEAFQDSEKRIRAAPPAQVGNYRILRLLGSGGMGAVYEAEETSSGQHVAVKVIAPEFANSEIGVERFRQEGRLASLISHPRCVFVLAADEQDGLPYIVMELISGRTLQQTVAERGPLPVEEAVAKILDVIEGLEEAHRLGVIHRDVKPSNCFLLEDGRVKIGDFGISKSLISGVDLTKTGTFLGTLLYASPEQIKGDRVDHRSDLYSVAATLYFLLVGRAPFQGKDAAATLARTVSEAPTPLRKLRPEVPHALDKIIRRGLDRSPERRWRNLDDLHSALRRFVPGRLSMGAMGLRAGAIVIDFLLFPTVSWLLLRLFGDALLADESLWTNLVGDAVLIAYFALFEGCFAATPGKWLLHLRVAKAHGSEPPGPLRAFVRTLLFYAFTNLILDVTALFHGPNPDFTTLLGVLSIPAGVLLMISSMRARNGFRGLHELWSGTRVIRLPWSQKPQRFLSRRPDRWTALVSEAAVSGRPDSCPQMMVGPFHICAALEKSEDEQLLLAEDPILGRKVLLQYRPATAPALEPARRILNRPTRLRWLSTGRQDDRSWDAFLAPAGCPLIDLCQTDQPLSWRACRSILEQLTAELVAACADGTLPAELSVEQIWIQPNGRVQLLDTVLAPAPSPEAPSPLTLFDERALRLVREATGLALEGRPGTESRLIHAPVPEHAARILGRLAGGADGYTRLADLQADLAATHDSLPEVNRRLRAVHLVVLAVAVNLPILLMFGLTLVVVSEERLEQLPVFARMQLPPSPDEISVAVLVFGFVFLMAAPVLWVIWAFLWRGGITLRMMGLTLVRRDGRRAGRWRCAYRALLVWLPPAILLFLAVLLKVSDNAATPRALVLWALALGYLLACIGLALWVPTRSWHDRLAGTYLVPK